LVKDIETEIAAVPAENDSSGLRRRHHYLTEHPAFSAMRGLVVFLLLSSGLFVLAGTEAFTKAGDHADALGQYIKYAGIFSFVGYLAGHDPTVFSSLIRLGSSRMTDPSTK
jgi:hypothetical protein